MAKKADVKTADDVVTEMVKDPTLDRYFDTNPVKLTDAQLDEFIENERERRAVFIAKDAGA